MPERETPIVVMWLEYVCDKCGEGTLEWCGSKKDHYGEPWYPHVCTNCDCPEKFQGFRHGKYPRKVYRTVTAPADATPVADPADVP